MNGFCRGLAILVAKFWAAGSVLYLDRLSTGSVLLVFRGSTVSVLFVDQVSTGIVLLVNLFLCGMFYV